jgi:hypothetical protein
MEILITVLMSSHGILKVNNRVFEGNFENNEIKNGKVTIYLDDRFYKYIGDFNKDRKFHGHGTLFLNKKGVKTTKFYEGEFKDDKMHGQGKSFNIFSNEVEYEGEFKDDKKNGKGKMYKYKTILDGEFKDDIFISGTKTTTTENNEVFKYSGTFNSDEQLSGDSCTFYINDKIIHKGKFENGNFIENNSDYAAKGDYNFFEKFTGRNLIDNLFN